MSITSEELQELISYKQRTQSKSVQQSEQLNIESIKSIQNDLIKIIKLEENVFSLEFKKVFTKQKQKQNMSEKLNRQYCTERNSREKDQSNESKKKNFDSDLKNEWMSVVDYNRHADRDQEKRDSFFLDEQIQTSEYVPINYERYPNPEHFEFSKTRQFAQVDNNFVKKSPHNKTKTTNIKTPKQISPKNNIKNNINAAKTPKTAKLQLKSTPSTPRMQRKVSQSLISPVKNFKKQILQEIQQKKQIEENQLALLMNKPKIELNKFYQTNQTHIPIYEKSKLLQTKKQQNNQNYTVHKVETELDDITFKPVINKMTEKLIEGRSFESRLEDYEVKKEQNQQRIMYEILQDFPFKPRLNSSDIAESRIKKIWQGQDKNDRNQLGRQITEQEDQNDSEMDSQKRKANRDYFALVLEQKEAEQIFVD